ncbi:MAG: GxxExxY protein [Gemmatimonadota bacterium]
MRHIPFEREVPIQLEFKGMILQCSYRCDLVVAAELIVEVKAVESLQPIHTAQLLTYLRLRRSRLGLLFNFHVPALKLGIRRVVNNF